MTFAGFKFKITAFQVASLGKFQHEPLRLLVVIDAPRKAISGIIQRHENVARLVNNGWLSLVSLEGETAHLYLAGQQWKKLDNLSSHETGVNHD
ncbi:DUF2309 family protein [bacterium]|nr:DUF2309 family protein [bacterium]